MIQMDIVDLNKVHYADLRDSSIVLTIGAMKSPLPSDVIGLYEL